MYIICITFGSTRQLRYVLPEYLEPHPRAEARALPLDSQDVRFHGFHRAPRVSPRKAKRQTTTKPPQASLLGYSFSPLIILYTLPSSTSIYVCTYAKTFVATTRTTTELYSRAMSVKTQFARCKFTRERKKRENRVYTRAERYQRYTIDRAVSGSLKS